MCNCHKQPCVRTVCAVLTAGPDGFRKPGSYQLFGLQCPCRSAECPGFGGRLMHHHLAGLANALFLSFLAAARGLEGSLRVSTAQTIRAVFWPWRRVRLCGRAVMSATCWHVRGGIVCVGPMLSYRQRATIVSTGRPSISRQAIWRRQICREGGDPAQLLLATAGLIRRRQVQPCSDLPTIAELMPVADALMNLPDASSPSVRLDGGKSNPKRGRFR